MWGLFPWILFYFDDLFPWIKYFLYYKGTMRGVIPSRSDLKEMAPYIGLSQNGAIKVTNAIDDAYRKEMV